MVARLAYNRSLGHYEHILIILAWPSTCVPLGVGDAPDHLWEIFNNWTSTDIYGQYLLVRVVVVVLMILPLVLCATSVGDGDDTRVVNG